MKKNLFANCVILFTLSFGLSSCSDDPAPAPTAEFTSEVDGSEVTFTSAVTNATSYLWNFGDDGTSTVANPVHSYVVSGTYTVTLIVSGDGGEVTATGTVDILPSFDEMLTGGPTAMNGKTWVLSAGYIEGVDGGGAVDPSLQILFASAENLLTVIGFPEEYDNEFTFKSDGTYKVDNKNGASIANLLYSLFGGAEGEVVRTEGGDPLNICKKEYTSPASSTWTLHEEDLVVTAAPYGGEDVPAATYNVTFTGRQWIGHFRKVPILESWISLPPASLSSNPLTPESMTVALFVCGYWSDPIGSGNVPTGCITRPLQNKYGSEPGLLG